MQVTNPLVPPTVGQSGGAAAPVANAPAVAESSKPQSAQPVTAAKESEGARNEARRDPLPDPREAARDPDRGQQVDIEA